MFPENKPYLDVLILQALRNDDEKALNHLFSTYYNILYRTGLKWSLDSHLTEECIQLIFQDLWQYRKSLGDIISFEAYLKGSLRKRLCKLSDAKINHENIENQVLPTASFEEILIAQEEDENKKQKLNQALESITPRQKEIIILKFFEELTYNEISLKTGLQVDSIYKTIHEGIKKLKGILAK